MMDRASAKNVGLKTSSLALLGVSAALLLAAGETLRHAHASAFGGGGRGDTNAGHCPLRDDGR